MRGKARPDHSSVPEIYIDRNNHNMIAIVAIWPTNDDDFLSRE
jgi:hypothetical protein